MRSCGIFTDESINQLPETMLTIHPKIIIPIAKTKEHPTNTIKTAEISITKMPEISTTMAIEGIKTIATATEIFRNRIIAIQGTQITSTTKISGVITGIIIIIMIKTTREQTTTISEAKITMEVTVILTKIHQITGTKTGFHNTNDIIVIQILREVHREDKITEIIKENTMISMVGTATIMIIDVEMKVTTDRMGQKTKNMGLQNSTDEGTPFKRKSLYKLL